MRRIRIVIAAAVIAALALPVAGAQASQKYPKGSPIKPQPPVKRKTHKLKVCTKKQLKRAKRERASKRGHKRGRKGHRGHRAQAAAKRNKRRGHKRSRRRHRPNCYATIQKAVNHAKAGDTVKVPHGTYRESVRISGKGKRELRLIGDPKHPGKVVLNGHGLKDKDGNAPQNGVEISGAHRVTVSGFTARNYAANGFFAVNVNGYTMNHLVAAHVGAYGLYAFNSVGGRMANSEAYYNNDSGYYIGQTPRQGRPVRSVVSNVKGWGSTLGFSGTNMKYVTIKNSIFWDNGLGIVPNTLASEKFPPNEGNVLINNKVFWNNFNYPKANPFYGAAGQSTSAPFPLGSGIFLLAGFNNRVENNQVWGNNLVGLGLVFQIDFPTWLDPSVGGDRKADCLRAQADILEGKPISVPGIEKVGDCDDDLDNARSERKSMSAKQRARLAKQDRGMAHQLEVAAEPQGNEFTNNRLDFNGAGAVDLNGNDYFMFVNPSNLPAALTGGAVYKGSAADNCMGPGPKGSQASPAQRGGVGAIYAGTAANYPECDAPQPALNPDPGSLGFAAGLLASNPTDSWPDVDHAATSGIKGLKPNKPLVNCVVVGNEANRHCKGFPK